MKPKSSYITVTDQFCGAGGSSQGVRNFSRRMGGGIEVKIALNHWKLAIETHNTNFPDTYHDCTDISACDPRRYMSTDILITSPECTNHSLAKGKKKQTNQLDLFNSGLLDPSAERSRATMWDVCRFAEYHNYNLIIVENVVDARSWIMWEPWLNAMFVLGYNHKCVYLNSMHAHPTPQSRDRMYIVFWKKGNKAPDLEYKPKAFCRVCKKEVESIQSWRNPRKQFGKYKQQYDYRCPCCGMIVDPYYYAAFNVIDWSIPGQRIGDRKNRLAVNTEARINYGLDKYGNSDFIIYLDHSKAGHLVSGIQDPINTQTTAQVAGIVIKNYGGGFNPKHSPIGLNEKLGTITTTDHHAVLGIPAMMTKGGYNGGVMPLSSPEPTITTQHNFGVVGMPTMIDQHNRTGKSKPLNDPVSTITSKGNHHGVLGLPGQAFIVENRGQSHAKEITKAIGAVTTKITHGILSTESVNAFLSYYYGNAQASGIESPTGTMTTKDRVALVFKPSDKIDINDCTYRMLKPHEIQAAMAFGNDYVVLGNSRDKIKQLGNAVTPPAMEWLIQRAVESIS